MNTGNSQKIMKWTTAFAMAGLACGAAQAQDEGANYPEKTVRIISGFAPGGGVDLQGRIIAEKLTEALGQSFIVENRTGANGTIATRNVLEAPADGYTLLMGGSSPMVFNPIAFVNLPYKAEDLCTVTILSDYPLVIAANNDLPVKDFADVVELAKERRVTYGTASVAFQVPMEHLSDLLDIQMTHVPYAGSGPAVQALMTGAIDLAVGDTSGLASFSNDGSIHAIAVSGDERNPSLPDVPTIAESGFPSFEANAFTALGVHCDTPPAIVAKLQQEIAKALTLPDVKEKLAQLGVRPVGNTPEEAMAEVKRQIDLYGPIAKAAGVQIGQ